MKNSLLVEQIKRITEMMGVSGYSSELLKESVVDDIASFLVKSGVKLTDEVAAISKLENLLGINPGTLTKQDIQDLAKVGDDVAKQNAMYKILQNTNSRLLDQLAEMVYKDMKITQKNVDDGLMALQDNINNGMAVTMDYVTRLASQNADKMIKMDGATGNLQVMTRKLREKMAEDFYSKISTLKNMDGTPFKFVDDAAGTAGKVGDETTDSLTDALNKAFSEETAETGIKIGDGTTTLESQIDDIIGKLDLKLPKGYNTKLIAEEMAAQVNKITKMIPSVDKLAAALAKMPPTDAANKIIKAAEGLSNLPKNPSWVKTKLADLIGTLKKNPQQAGTKGSVNIAKNLFNIYAISVVANLVYYVGKCVINLQDESNQETAKQTLKGCVTDALKALGGFFIPIAQAWFAITGDEESVTTNPSRTYTNDINGFKKFAADNNWGAVTWFFNIMTKKGEHQETPSDYTSWYYYDWDATNNNFVKGTKI